MEQKQLLDWHFGKHVNVLFVSQHYLQCVSEHFADTRLDTEISCEIQPHKFVRVESVDTHVHLVELCFGSSEGFFEVASFELVKNVLVQVSKHS